MYRIIQHHVKPPIVIAISRGASSSNRYVKTKIAAESSISNECIRKRLSKVDDALAIEGAEDVVKCLTADAQNVQLYNCRNSSRGVMGSLPLSKHMPKDSFWGVLPKGALEF